MAKGQQQQHNERSYSSWDIILNTPRLDRAENRLKEDEKRIEKNYKRILARGNIKSKRPNRARDGVLYAAE